MKRGTRGVNHPRFIRVTEASIIRINRRRVPHLSPGVRAVGTPGSLLLACLELISSCISRAHLVLLALLRPRGPHRWDPPRLRLLSASPRPAGRAARAGKGKAARKGALRDIAAPNWYVTAGKPPAREPFVLPLLRGRRPRSKGRKAARKGAWRRRRRPALAAAPMGARRSRPWRRPAAAGSCGPTLASRLGDARAPRAPPP